MYYIEDNNEIVLCDESIDKINDTLEFLPQYKDFEIWETNKNIVEFEGKFYFEDDEDYIAQRDAKERERINKLSLTKREVFLALYRDKGITPEQIKAQIEDTESLIEFEYASEYFRGNPLINAIGQQLGYTSAELDYLFEHKELPEQAE